MCRRALAGINDALKEKTGRRGCPRGRLVGKSFKQPAELAYRQTATANLRESADETPHHLPKEVARADAKKDETAVREDVRRLDLDYG